MMLLSQGLERGPNRRGSAEADASGHSNIPMND